MSFTAWIPRLVVMATLLLPLAPLQAEDVIVDAGRGPVNLHIPPDYVEGTATPLIVLLHGYGSSGAGQESYMQFTPLSDERGFLFATPDGLTDLFGLHYWNGTDACCQFFGTPTDDSGYLRNLIDVIVQQYTVDPKRIYFIGHSNGGFMSHRMACDHADTVAAIASLAGAAWEDPANCSPGEPVHMLQIHGTADSTVSFNGGCFFGQGCYPSAPATTGQWAVRNGCALTPQFVGPPRDLVTEVPGGDTVAVKFANGCNTGGSSELWVIVGGFHTPGLTAEFSPAVIDYLLAHPKP